MQKHSIPFLFALFGIVSTCLILLVSISRASVDHYITKECSPGLVLSPPESPSFAQNPADWQLPFPGILPGDWRYFTKTIRLKIWLSMAQSPKEQAYILTNEASKDLSAVLIWWQRGNPTNELLAWEEAAKKLILANTLSPSSPENQIITERLQHLSTIMLTLATQNHLQPADKYLQKIHSFANPK